MNIFYKSFVFIQVQFIQMNVIVQKYQLTLGFQMLNVELISNKSITISNPLRKQILVLYLIK